MPEFHRVFFNLFYVVFSVCSIIFSTFFSGLLVNGRDVSPLELVLSLCSAPTLRRTSVQGSMKSLADRGAETSMVSSSKYTNLDQFKFSRQVLKSPGVQWLRSMSKYQNHMCDESMCSRQTFPNRDCKLPAFRDVFRTCGCRYSWGQAICWLGDHGS